MSRHAAFLCRRERRHRHKSAGIRAAEEIGMTARCARAVVAVPPMP
jgi:hypothetical protein